MSKKSRKNRVNKSKRPTAAQQRVGMVVVQVEPEINSEIYKTKPPRRHRGPITAGAIAGTGQSSNRRAKRGKK